MELLITALVAAAWTRSDLNALTGEVGFIRVIML